MFTVPAIASPALNQIRAQAAAASGILATVRLIRSFQSAFRESLGKSWKQMNDAQKDGLKKRTKQLREALRNEKIFLKKLKNRTRL